MPMPIESLLTQENQLEAEIEKLFVFQDKTLSKEKRLVLTQEILSYGFPFGAILQGIRSLRNEELTNLKLHVLVSAIRKFIHQENVDSDCISCLSGIVLMRDQEKRVFSLVCYCAKGQSRSSLGLTAWNGEDTMISKNRLLEKY